MSLKNEYLELLNEALKIRHNAYVPYSNYKVGAALLCKNGKIYTGCNIENAAFSPTVCAERVAFFSAVKDGEREFVAIAVVAGGKDEKRLDFASPCGVCRQIMTEFCNDDFEIILAKTDEENKVEAYKVMTLDEILPGRFKKF